MAASISSTPGIKRRAVSGSFLFKSDGEGVKKVALFRRSNKVRTYQGKLAPISGSVEESDKNPLETALREIREETTLTLKDIELLRVGKPYTFTDEAIGREWTINPFAWRLKTVHEGGRGEDGIKIDWEHQDWEWHNPLKVNETEEFGGVPKLVNSLRRVWPEYDLGEDARNALTKGLVDLKTDHESGARVLAAKAVKVLGDVVKGMKTTNVDDTWWDNVRMAAWHIWKNGRESMDAAILSSLVTVLDRIRTFTEANKSSVHVDDIIKVIDGYTHDGINSMDRIRKALVDYVKSEKIKCSSLSTEKGQLTVLTLSFSSTILECLLKLATELQKHDIDLNIRILESRPLCEGVALASSLLDRSSEWGNFKLSLYPDASVTLAAKDIDLLVIGADRISSTGDVSNKTGSLPAVLSARYAAPSAKVVVLSEIAKVAPGSSEGHVVEENDVQELTKFWHASGVKGSSDIGQNSRLELKNVYFEWVPAAYIDAYITDSGQGLLTTEDIKKRSKWVAQVAERLFDDL